MMARFRVAGLSGALVLSGLIGSTLISATLAAPAPAPASAVSDIAAAAADTAAAAPDTAAASDARAGFRAAFAANLGKTEAQVTAAAKAAIASTLDAAVAGGTLTAEAAARVKTRVAAASGEGCRLRSGRPVRAVAAVSVARDAFVAAASSIDMSSAELRAELRAGASLKDVAAVKGVDYASLTSAVMTSVKQDLDAAVAAGKLSQPRADRILKRLEARLAAGWARPAPSEAP